MMLKGALSSLCQMDLISQQQSSTLEHLLIVKESKAFLATSSSQMYFYLYDVTIPTWGLIFDKDHLHLNLPA